MNICPQISQISQVGFLSAPLRLCLKILIPIQILATEGTEVFEFRCKASEFSFSSVAFLDRFLLGAA